MPKTSKCPGCGAPLSLNADQCSFCGQYIERTVQFNTDQQGSAASDAPHVQPGNVIISVPPQEAWTQGISADGRSNGSYDAVEYPALPLKDALRILESMPVPPNET